MSDRLRSFEALVEVRRCRAALATTSDVALINSIVGRFTPLLPLLSDIERALTHCAVAHALMQTSSVVDAAWSFHTNINSANNATSTQQSTTKKTTTTNNVTIRGRRNASRTNCVSAASLSASVTTTTMATAAVNDALCAAQHHAREALRLSYNVGNAQCINDAARLVAALGARSSLPFALDTALGLSLRSRYVVTYHDIVTVSTPSQQTSITTTKAPPNDVESLTNSMHKLDINASTITPFQRFVSFDQPNLQQQHNVNCHPHLSHLVIVYYRRFTTLKITGCQH